MICKQCNQPLDDNAFFCTNCGYRPKLVEQEAKLAQANAKLRDLLPTQTHSLMFLIFSACFSVMTFMQFISLFTGGFWGFLTSILPFVFMGISTFGLWTCYLNKDSGKIGGAFKNASLYDAYNRVMSSIGIVLTVVLGLIVIILILAGGAALSSFTDSGEGGTMMVVLIALIVLAVTVFVMSLFKKIYANRRAYFLDLSQYAENGSYKAEKAPTIGSYIIGGYNALSGLISIFSATAIRSLIGNIVDMFGEIDFIGDMINGFVSGATSGMVVSGLLQLVCGGYYICSALWMNETHNALVTARTAVVQETEAYNSVQNLTKNAISEFNLAQQAKKDREKEMADEEARKAQEALRDQQNAMMQMMMQQMMANGMMGNGMVNNMQNPQAPAANEADNAPSEINS